MSMLDTRMFYLLRCNIISGVCEVINDFLTQEDATENAEALTLQDPNTDVFYLTLDSNELY